MNLFHTHKWIEVGRDYVPPLSPDIYVRLGQMSIEDSRALRKSQLRGGTTYVFLKCSECGDIKQKDLAGNYDTNSRTNSESSNSPS